MVPRCCLVLALLGSLVVAQAADPKSEVTTVISLSSSFFGKTDPVRKTIEGLPRLESSKAARFSGTVLDARPFLEKLDIGKIESLEAIYFISENVLFLRGNLDEVERVEGYLCKVGSDVSTLAKNEMLLVSFRMNGGKLETPAQTYEEFRASAGDSWREIARFEVSSKSQMRARAMLIEGEAVKEDSSELSPGMKGSIFEVETFIGDNGVQIDATISFKCRVGVDGLSTPLDVQYFGSTSLWNGRQQVLQVLPFGNDGSHCALIMRTTMVWPSTEHVIQKGF
jgi:hypothetical protein